MWTELGGESREGKGFGSPKFSPNGLHVSSRRRPNVKEVEHKGQLEFGTKFIPGSSVSPREPQQGRGGRGDSGLWPWMCCLSFRVAWGGCLLSRPGLLAFLLTGCEHSYPRTFALAAHFAWNALLDNHTVPSISSFRPFPQYHSLLRPPDRPI